MPFKDKDKQREYDRERMRRTREKKREEKRSKLADMAVDAVCIGEICEISKTDPVILDILKDNPDMTAEQVIRIYARLMEGKKKKERKLSLMDIPDLIFKHFDLQFIQLAGGTA